MRYSHGTSVEVSAPTHRSLCFALWLRNCRTLWGGWGGGERDGERDRETYLSDFYSREAEIERLTMSHIEYDWHFSHRFINTHRDTHAHDQVHTHTHTPVHDQVHTHTETHTCP